MRSLKLAACVFGQDTILVQVDSVEWRERFDPGITENWRSPRSPWTTEHQAGTVQTARVHQDHVQCDVTEEFRLLGTQIGGKVSPRVNFSSAATGFRAAPPVGRRGETRQRRLRAPRRRNGTPPRGSTSARAAREARRQGTAARERRPPLAVPCHATSVGAATVAGRTWRRSWTPCVRDTINVVSIPLICLKRYAARACTTPDFQNAAGPPQTFTDGTRLRNNRRTAPFYTT